MHVTKDDAISSRAPILSSSHEVAGPAVSASSASSDAQNPKAPVPKRQRKTPTTMFITRTKPKSTNVSNQYTGFGTSRLAETEGITGRSLVSPAGAVAKESIIGSKTISRLKIEKVKSAKKRRRNKKNSRKEQETKRVRLPESRQWTHDELAKVFTAWSQECKVWRRIRKAREEITDEKTNKICEVALWRKWY